MQKRSGFSLVELSIVIVLIGLISGLVLAGQSFIRRQELRRIIVDTNSYVTAVEQFRIKYGELPGDFSSATNVWGALSTCPGTAKGGTATCNGNGNGAINGSAGGESSLCEQYRVWQHLANGGYIQGNYSGFSATAAAPTVCTANSTPGSNVPSGAGDATGYTFIAPGYFVNEGNSTYYDGDYKNALIFGVAKLNDVTQYPALKTEEAKEIDRKIDDGLPGLGNVRAMRPANAATPNCTKAVAASSISATDYYQETYRTNLACSLIFMDTYLRKNNR